MAYSILGEIVPFGFKKRPDGSIDLKADSRDVNNYVAFVASAAAELKRWSPRHLVNAGGLRLIINSQQDEVEAWR